MNADEKRGYSRGYAAGKRRLRIDYSRELADSEREEFRRQAALVALTAITQPGVNWGLTVDGKHAPYRTMDEYAKAAFSFADKMVRHTYFAGLLPAQAIEAQRAETGTGSVHESAVGIADAPKE